MSRSRLQYHSNSSVPSLRLHVLSSICWREGLHVPITPTFNTNNTTWPDEINIWKPTSSAPRQTKLSGADEEVVSK